MTNYEYPLLDPADALARTRKWMGTDRRSTMCAQFVQEDLLNGRSGNYDNARQWYNDAKNKKWIKTSAPPAGVPVFYAGNAANKLGHVAISAGGGYVYSTDAYGNKVGKVRYDKLWGGTGSGQYLGWTGNIRTDRKGGYAHVNYDPATAGKELIVPGSIPTGSVGTGKGVGVNTGADNQNVGQQFSKGTIGTPVRSARIL